MSADIASAILAEWPEDQRVNIARIGFLESGWNPRAVNDTRYRAGGLCGQSYLLPDGTRAQTEYSAGWLQVNICAHGESATWWFDPQHSAQKGYALYQARGQRYSDWWISAGRLGLPR